MTLITTKPDGDPRTKIEIWDGGTDGKEGTNTALFEVNKGKKGGLRRKPKMERKSIVVNSTQEAFLVRPATPH